jgi:hypothetical protein
MVRLRIVGLGDMGLGRSRSVVVAGLMSIPWNLMVARLFGHNTRRRSSSSLMTKLKWFLRNGLGSRGIRKLVR